MRYSAPLALLVSLLLPTSSARADIIHLKHGGKIEGTVVARTKRELKVKVQGGGSMALPVAVVARVETRSSALEDYAQVVLTTNMEDPAAIDRLAMWCSRRGLGDKAKSLLAMAQGLRLEQRVAVARRTKNVERFADVYHWARSAGLDDAVLLWILDQGKRIEPNSRVLAAAYRQFREDIAERRDRAAYLEELRKRPRYAMPGRQTMMAVSPSPGVMKARIAREREEHLAKGPWPAEEEEFLDAAKAARIREAEFRSGLLAKRRAAEQRAQQRVEREAERLRLEEIDRLAKEEAERWAQERAHQRQLLEDARADEVHQAIDRAASGR